MTIIDEDELVRALNAFRDILIDFDFSEVKNIVFFNMDSLFIYMDMFEDNPFKRQFLALEEEFKIILPYIPCSIPDDAVALITKILEPKYQDRDLIQKNINFNIKLDFIQMVKNIQTDRQWYQLVKLCKEILEQKRKEKELVYL